MNSEIRGQLQSSISLPMPAPRQVPPSTGRGSLIPRPITGALAQRRSREARLERGVLGAFALLALTVGGFAGYAITTGSRPYAVRAVLPAAISGFAWNRPVQERPAGPALDLDPATTGALPERRPAKPLPEAPDPTESYTLRRVSGGVAVVAEAGGTEREVSAGSDLPGAGRVLAIRNTGAGWVVITSETIIGPARL